MSSAEHEQARREHAPQAGTAPQAGSLRGRAGYLGPAGTFSEQALLASAAPGAIEPVAIASIYDTITAVGTGEVDWAIVPIENSLDGSINVTLDLLAERQGGLEIVGEALLAVKHSLIAHEPLALAAIDTVISHPQVPGQCTRFLRGELGHARVLPASSTAEAVRIVAAERRSGTAALGTALAAEIYGGVVLRENVQDRDDNVTRFVWLAGAERGARPGSGARTPPLRTGTLSQDTGEGGWKTSLVFWGAGADSPGWLVRCLDEFARRGLNLTKIESRPQRAKLGHYMFFTDLQGSLGEEPVASAVDGLRALCEEVRVLGSYPAA